MEGALDTYERVEQMLPATVEVERLYKATSRELELSKIAFGYSYQAAKQAQARPGTIELIVGNGVLSTYCASIFRHRL